MSEKFKVTLNKIVNGVLTVEHKIIENIETAINHARKLLSLHKNSSVKITDESGKVIKTFGTLADNSYSS
jgi:hypothetical protein